MKEQQISGLKRRRQFDEIYKRHAVELSLRVEHTVKAVAEELGISPDRLYLWRGLYAPKPSGMAKAKKSGCRFKRKCVHQLLPGPDSRR